MLRDINHRRPDRQLERNLVFLAYAIMFLALGMLAFFIYPQYSLYIIIFMVFWNIACILMTIRILKVGEYAIGFGALAGEILNDKTKYYRIDNSLGEIILANQLAVDYFKDIPVLAFLEKNIISSAANKLDLQKLTSAVAKLQETEVELSINPNQNSVFLAEEWLKVKVKPIYLNKADIFEGEYSLKKICKETYLFWTIENITAYKNMEQIFQNEMSSLQNFLDFLPVGLYTCNKVGEIEYINQTLADWLKIERNTAIGCPIDDYIAHKSELLHTAGDFAGNMLFSVNKNPVEAFVKQQNIHENNEYKTHGVVIWNLPNDRDLTAQLHGCFDKLEAIFSTAPIGIIVADKELSVLQINQYALDIFKQDEKDFLQQKIAAKFNTEAAAKFTEAVQVFTDQSDSEYNFATTIAAEGQEKSVQLHIMPMYSRYAPTGDAIVGLIIYIEDTTGKRNLEMQVAQAQKMQAFGQLAGGVAHDFNNLLTAVIGYCDLLIQRHGVGDPSFSDLVQIKQNANRAAGVARQLLAISRKQPLNPKLIDVTEAFSEIDHLLIRLLGEQIKFQINYGTDLGYIRVDPVQFSQVMINLAINAKDAMGGKGTLTIATRPERLNKPYNFGTDVIKPGDFVVISVSDTGCGIPPENINRIFEPFFSTKKNVVGSGTGLGLAMVYGIVRQTEGFIKVFSEVGKGTTFEIYLPAYENKEIAEIPEKNQPQEEVIRDKSGKAAMTTVAPAVGLDAGKMILGLNVNTFDSQRTLAGHTNEFRILFVEDEDAVRTVGARGLRQKGFSVTDCISAENALEHIQNGEKYDMMITDMMMPGMSGTELAALVRQKQPEIIIILASGYSEEIARKELAGSSDFYFLSKPYSLGDLHKKVMEVLAQNE